MIAFGGELYFLLSNNGFKPTLVTKHCNYQYFWPFLEQKTLPHEGPFCFFFNGMYWYTDILELSFPNLSEVSVQLPSRTRSFDMEVSGKFGGQEEAPLHVALR